MKLSTALVCAALLAFLAPIGCAGGSDRRTAEPTTLPSASRPPTPPTRVRTEQSREDPLQVDGRTEPMSTRGGPLERRQLPSNQDPLDLPEVNPPRADDAVPPGATTPGARRATDDEDEIPGDLERGGPDPAESGSGTSSGGFIPIDIPPKAAPSR